MTVNYPKIIYKYRSWNNEFHRNILLKNEVYMSPPKNFNDPFDCRIPKNHYLIDTPEKINRYVNDVIENRRDKLIYNGKNIKCEKKRLRKRLQDIDTYQKEYEELEFTETDNNYGVLSLSGRWNSILMWSHYGDFHKGFCIGYNEFKMRTSGLFGKGGPVIYSTDFPKINPMIKEHTMVTDFYKTHYKAQEWEYEQEYRLTNHFSSQIHTYENRIIKIPEEFVEEINLGINISNIHRKQINNECKRRNIKVFQTKKAPFKFELDRIEL